MEKYRPKDFMEVCKEHRKKADEINSDLTKARRRFMRVKGQYSDVWAVFPIKDDFKTITFRSELASKKWTDIEFKGWFVFPYVKFMNEKIYAQQVVVLISDPDQDKWQHDAKMFYGERSIPIIREYILKKMVE